MPWFYARAGSTERLGPVSSEQMRGLLTGGAVAASDLVWREGMAEWTPVERLPILAALLPAAPIAEAIPASYDGATAYPAQSAGFASAAAPASLTYYTPRSDMPYRAQQNLANYAPATGPSGEWPLNDGHIAQFAHAVKLRKRINAAYGVSRLGFALCVIVAAGAVVGGLVGMATSRNGAFEAMMIAAVCLVFYGGLGTLYFFIGRAIRRCHVWGSIVLGVFASLGVLGSLLMLAAGLIASATPTTRNGDAAGPILVGGFSLLISGAICWVCWRGFAATKPYLNTPLWCQEALAVSETVK